MELPSEIFKANDIRGLLSQVTADIARAAGRALVTMTGAKTIVVGRDMRATSPELARAVIEGITAMGSDVVDIGLCTTSLFNFAVTSQEHVEAGVMVTASHNPPEYNGMKFARANGLPISGTDILPVIQGLSSEEVGGGVVTRRDVLPAYLDACVASMEMPNVAGTKVAVDFGNGMGAMTLKPLCERLGVEMISLYEEPDARFPNHEANPAKTETLEDVKRLVVSERADFAVALDGDADRIAFIDNEANHLRGDQVLAIFAQDILAREPGVGVVVAPSMSWSTMDAIHDAGGKTVECAIGRTKVIAAMHKEGAVLGGEISSHFMFREFHNLEAVDHAFVRMLAVWKRSGKAFADFVRPQRTFANTGEINLEVHDKSAAIDRVKERFAAMATLVNTIDGIRCEFSHDWWFLVRPSNTEPILRLIIEAKDETLLQEKRDALIETIAAV